VAQKRYDRRVLYLENSRIGTGVDNDTTGASWSTNWKGSGPTVDGDAVQGVIIERDLELHTAYIRMNCFVRKQINFYGSESRVVSNDTGNERGWTCYGTSYDSYSL
jgi:hypothetical protein